MPSTHQAQLSASSRSSAESATERAVNAIRDLVLSGELSPGQQVRQVPLAQRIQMSRSPVREALRVLSAEGIVTYTRNIGYAIATLSADELSEIYLMRRCLETELAHHIGPLPAEAIEDLTALNMKIESAAHRIDIAEIKILNRNFHFKTFERANKSLVVSELRRLWSMVDHYHSFYLYDGEARTRIVKEHRDIIDALRDENVPALVEAMDSHRASTEKFLRMVLSPGAERGGAS
jgi:DNA-binding GntR family transcriptional regulator